MIDKFFSPLQCLPYGSTEGGGAPRVPDVFQKLDRKVFSVGMIEVGSFGYCISS